MKNECSIVRDLLPLYAENMLSDETTEFVSQHLEKCSECFSANERICEVPTVKEADFENKIETSLRKIRKKFIKKAVSVFAILIVCVVALTALLQVFPIYRVVGRPYYKSYYTVGEMWKLGYIGSPSDRKKAKEILNQAEMAFSDISHTYEENQETYGLLGRYAFTKDYNATFEKHMIKLLSAHLGKDKGYLWIEYDQQAYGEDAEVVSGSSDIQSLWTVEKDENGKWVVTNIKEHP